MACELICMSAAQSAEVQPISISSTAFPEGGTIPERYTCNGDGKSPPLSWSGVPTSASTLALIVDDPDAPAGVFTHWVVYNLPAKLSALPEGFPPTPTLPNGGRQGLNGLGRVGYKGPCPPPGPPHHYHFKLYALALSLRLGSDADARAVSTAMQGHVLARGETVGLFGR